MATTFTIQLYQLPLGLKLYGVYQGMLDRCYNKNSKAYADYGGRGIKVCDEWHNNFIAFYKWAIESGYSFEPTENTREKKKQHNKWTLDRINVNSNYEPKNCRWATSYIQVHNRRPREEWKKTNEKEKDYIKLYTNNVKRYEQAYPLKEVKKENIPVKKIKVSRFVIVDENGTREYKAL